MRESSSIVVLKIRLLLSSVVADVLSSHHQPWDPQPMEG